jgi:hypothetical protein
MATATGGMCMSENRQLKPLFLVKPDSMSRKDINRAERLSGICIVECKDPDSARYSEPPLTANLDDQARAALSLMRTVVNHPNSNFTRGELTKWFIDSLLSWNAPKTVTPVARK